LSNQVSFEVEEKYLLDEAILYTMESLPSGDKGTEMEGGPEVDTPGKKREASN
jgi:hypothetical protein